MTIATSILVVGLVLSLVGLSIVVTLSAIGHELSEIVLALEYKEHHD